jgi:hypothetical protein
MNGQGAHKKPLTDHELDQLFRDAHASESMEPFFVESYWKEMEAMIPAPKRNVGSIYLLAAASIISAFLCVFPLENPQLHPMESLGSTTKVSSSDEVNRASNIQTSLVEENSPNSSDNDMRVQKPGTAQIASFGKKESTIELNQRLVQVDRDTANFSHVGITNEPDESVTHETNAVELNLLEKRNITDVSKDVLPTSLKKNPLTSYYLELGVTCGQSPYYNTSGKRDAIGGLVLGGGIGITSGRTFFNGGIQLRIEGFKGLTYTENNFTAQNMSRVVDVNQLYSVEFPLSFGYRSVKHQVGMSFIPGIQCFMSGKETIYSSTIETREAHIVGPVEHSNSLTMEIGLNYYYHFNAHWALGAKLNTDILRPFRTEYYLGSNALFPINGQLILRRNLF